MNFYPRRETKYLELKEFMSELVEGLTQEEIDNLTDEDEWEYYWNGEREVIIKIGEYDKDNNK